MKIKELSQAEINERISIIISNLKNEFSRGIYQQYFDDFIRQHKIGIGKWYLCTKSWYDITKKNETFEFIYFFKVQRGDKNYIQYLNDNLNSINHLLKHIAIDVMRNLANFNFSISNIRIPTRIMVIFTPFAGNIRSGAFLNISAKDWFFPIVESYNKKNGNLKEKFYLLVSSIIHEMEHAANFDKTLKGAFQEQENTSTFVEYLSVPMLIKCRHESEYLPTVLEYIISNKKGKNFYHASAFYMSLIIFFDYLSRKEEFKKIPQIMEFPKLNIDQKFYILINLRKVMRKYKKGFMRYAKECLELIYQSGNYSNFEDLFRKAENNLNLEQLKI